MLVDLARNDLSRVCRPESKLEQMPENCVGMHVKRKNAHLRYSVEKP